MILVSSCSCLCPTHSSQMLSREWRRTWSSADRRCSKYIWVILFSTKVRLILKTWRYFTFEGICTWFALCCVLLWIDALITAWISNYFHYKVWGEIEVWESISNFIPCFTGYVISYPCWDNTCSNPRGYEKNIHMNQIATKQSSAKSWNKLYSMNMEIHWYSTHKGPVIYSFGVFFVCILKNFKK